MTQLHRSYAVALGAHPNIELKEYNPPSLLRPWSWNGWLHDKYVIVDNRLLLLGGRNIGDKYFAPEGYDGALSYDREVLVYNTAWAEQEADGVVFDVRSYMDGLWSGPDVRCSFSEDSDSGTERRELLRASYAQFRTEHPALFDHRSDDYTAQTLAANRVTFLHNDTQTGPKEPKVDYVLGELLRDAEESVVLQSPYVILAPMLEDLLKELGEKKIEVKILTNSAASSPKPIAYCILGGSKHDSEKQGPRIGVLRRKFNPCQDLSNRRAVDPCGVL